MANEREGRRRQIAYSDKDARPTLAFPPKANSEQCRLAGLLAWFTAEHLPMAPGRHSGMKNQQVSVRPAERRSDGASSE